MEKQRTGERVEIAVSVDDAGWAMDAMRERADAYERTAEYLEDGDSDDAAFEIEEVSDAAEARGIAKSYRDVIKRIEVKLATAK